MFQHLKIPINFLVLFIFFVIFVYSSVTTMVNVPLYDFDEAHRAENAKRMKEYKSFFIPLTGSSQDRAEHLKIPFKENPNYYLYYHLERPPLVYDLMIISTSIFGTSEWAYRLPSFLLGIFSFLVFLYFGGQEESKNKFAITIGLLALITSGDLWLSSQFAQMDTGITLFMFSALLSLVYYVIGRKTILIYLSGIFFGLALLSKLQPAAVFAFPLLFLLFTHTLKFKELFKFLAGFLLIFLPWIAYLVLKFGIVDVLNIMPGFAISSASFISIHLEAPVFWYIRWWWEAFRPGWTIFLALVIFDYTLKRLDLKKKILLFYIFGGLLVFSLPINKIWWYVLPLIPAVSYYVFLSVKDYLKNGGKLINLSFALIVASVPIFLRTSNTVSLIYGFSVTAIVLFILRDKLSIRIDLNKDKLFTISILLCLAFFLTQFPTIRPYHINTKSVAQYYRDLPYPKCLWLGDMPGESVLFYSEAGNVEKYIDKNPQIYAACKNNYLITPERFKEGELLIRVGAIRLYKL